MRDFTRTARRLPRHLLAFIVGFGLLGATACDSLGPGADETEDGSQGGTFDVRLTDAPGDVTQAVVTIQRVSVVPVEDSSSGDAREGGIELLSDSAFTADLTKLQAGVDTALASVDSMPPGTYGQIRVVTADTADVLYETQDGGEAVAELKQPSASETGIKINFDPVTIESPEDQAEVTLDFSVKDSFVKAGRSGMYIFKPTIQAESVVANGDTTGTGDNG